MDTVLPLRRKYHTLSQFHNDFCYEAIHLGARDAWKVTLFLTEASFFQYSYELGFIALISAVLLRFQLQLCNYIK